MTSTLDDLMGLYAPEIATYKDLSLLIETSTIEENPNGSVLAASLLQLPEVFTQNTAAVILDSVGFSVPLEEREFLAGEGEYESLADALAKRFDRLDSIDKEEQNLEPVDVGVLEEIISFAQDDVDAARELFQATDDLRHEEQRKLSPVEKVRLLLAELKHDSTEVTAGQFMLVEDYETSAVAARSFPAAETLLSALQVKDMTPAEKRKADRLDRAVREREAGSGNRIMAESTDLEIAILLEEDPETLASIALNTRTVEREQLLEVLENASDLMIANWMFGLEVQQPQPGEIEKLVTRFSEDRINELAQECQTLLAKREEGEGGGTNPVPWIVDIIRHVYIPRIPLDAATAALVWHQLSDLCGDDPSMWLAVLLSDTSETPTRLQDIV